MLFMLRIDVLIWNKRLSISNSSESELQPESSSAATIAPEAAFSMQTCTVTNQSSSTPPKKLLISPTFSKQIVH